jgi:hypothetical protein
VRYFSHDVGRFLDVNEVTQYLDDILNGSRVIPSNSSISCGTGKSSFLKLA